MKRKISNIRKIRFGLRYKLSLIIIIGIAFVSSIIGFTIFKQHEAKIKEEMHRLGAIILKGTEDDITSYLRLDNFLKSDGAEKYSDIRIRHIREKRDKSLLQAAEYFSSIVEKETFLDIAFLIKLDWKNTDIDWRRSDLAEYWYFKRRSPSIKLKVKNDPQLKPSIFSHYMHRIDLHPYLTFAEGRDEEEKQFVIIGMPIFKKKSDAAFYEKFLDTQKTIFTSAKDVISYNKEKKKYEYLFIRRLVRHETSFNYNVHLDSDKKIEKLYYFIPWYFNVRHLDKNQMVELNSELNRMIKENIKSNSIPIAEIKKSFIQIIKKYKIPLKSRYERSIPWEKLFYLLHRNKITVSSPVPLEELALISYRKDLTGVLGLFLLRTKFFSELARNRTEIINLSLAVFLRCIFIALFLPTFIIKSVSRLAAGAYEIGRGNLDEKIELKGSDELGRLADIFNAMTKNLKKAQETMLEKQRMQEELKTAQQIQSTLLPATYPDIKGIEFGSYYSAQTEAGGDYYDFIKLDNKKIGIAVADVSGHGVGSGLVMAMTRTLLHIHCQKFSSTKKIFENMNEYLYTNTESNYFVSMFYGVLDITSMSLTFSSAGHHQALILRNNAIKELPAGGIALGAVSNTMFSNITDTKSTKIHKGDYIVQYTDGIIEAMDKDRNEFGEERFKEALLAQADKTPQEIVDSVIASVAQFTGNIPQHDDVTLIIMHIT